MLFGFSSIELESLPERSDGLLVGKALGLRPENETAGEVRSGQVRIEIQRLGQCHIGILAQPLPVGL